MINDQRNKKNNMRSKKIDHQLYGSASKTYSTPELAICSRIQDEIIEENIKRRGKTGRKQKRNRTINRHMMTRQFTRGLHNRQMQWCKKKTRRIREGTRETEKLNDNSQYQ